MNGRAFLTILFLMTSLFLTTILIFDDDPVFNDDPISDIPNIEPKSSLSSSFNIFKSLESPPNRYFDSVDEALEVIKRWARDRDYAMMGDRPKGSIGGVKRKKKAN